MAFVQLLSHVWLFATPWTTAHQASQSFTISLSFYKLMSIESVMPPNDLILCCPLLLQPSVFPSIRVFPSESALSSGGQTIGVSASALVLPMNTQYWFPLGWAGLISLQSKELSRIFSSTAIQKHPFSVFFIVQLSHPCMTNGKTIALAIQTFVSKVISLLFNTLSWFNIVFLPRNKCF